MYIGKKGLCMQGINRLDKKAPITMYIEKTRECVKKQVIIMYIGKKSICMQWINRVDKKSTNYYVYKEKKGLCKKSSEYYVYTENNEFGKRVVITMYIGKRSIW